jgi:predicted nucleic acid-binding protein
VTEPPPLPLIALDNDILLKVSCYRSSALLWRHAEVAHTIGVLGQARYVVSKRIPRMKLNGSLDDILAELALILGRASVLEPTEDEAALAAEIEVRASHSGQQLDSGESQLAAIVAARNLDLLQTGDKRGIRALEVLLDAVAALAHLSGRVMCLEQLFRQAVEQGSMAELRPCVCQEHAVDTALAMCFACHTPDLTADDVLSGLSSYIEDLRRQAPRILVG